MAIRRLLTTTGRGVLLGSLAIAACGCATGSPRTDYLVSRSTVHTATRGDGSMLRRSAGEPGETWSASLTFVPTLDAGDVSAGR